MFWLKPLGYIMIVMSFCKIAYGGSPIPPPPVDGLAIGLGAGLGVGLPFICVQSLNFVLLKSIWKDLFGTNIESTKNVIREEKFDDNDQISCPSDLNCDVNGGIKNKDICEWENNPRDRPCKEDFFAVEGKPTKLKRWSKFMGNKKLPEGGYFAFASKKSGYPVSLLSRTIPEQIEDGFIQMKYWLTPPATLQICFLFQKSDYKELNNCSGVVRNSKKHIAQFRIKGPILSSFKIMIQASNFAVKQGSIVIIEDIQYISDLCQSDEMLAYCRYSSWKRQGIPGPSYLPFCGDFVEMISSLHMKTDLRLSRWVRKYGKVFGYYGSSFPMLAIADASLAKEILYFNDDYNDPAVTTDSITPRCGEYRYIEMQLSQLRDKKWRLVKNFVSTAFTTKSVEQLIPTVNESCSDLVTYLNTKSMFGDASFVIHFKQLLSVTMVNVLFQLLTPFSPDIVKVLLENYEDSEKEKTIAVHVRNNFPFLYNILAFEGLINLSNARRQNILDKVKAYASQCRKQTTTKSQQTSRDYLTMMRLRRKKMLENSRTEKLIPTEDDIFAQLYNFLLPNTPSNALCCLFYELAKHSNIQDKCRSEAMCFENLDCMNTWNAIGENLPIILASLRETSRLYPTSLQLSRKTIRDSVLNGIHLTKGCFLVVLIRDIMRDENIFSEPDVFNPQRFIDKSENEYKADGAYLAFGIGGRRCIGEKLVMMVLSLFTAHLLRNFEIQLDHPGQQLNVDYQTGTMTVDREFKLKLKKLPVNNPEA